MSKVETLALAPPRDEYAEWLARERRNRLTIRSTQLALLLIFLVLWEVLPRAQIVNPLFTSYPSALWPTALSAQRDVEAGTQVAEPFGGFVGEDQAQVPAAAGAPAIHRGGGDLGPGEQPLGYFTGS